MGIELGAWLDNMIHQRELQRKRLREGPMKKIVRLTVDVLVPDDPAFQMSAGLQTRAWELCEQAGRYLRSQLQKEIDVTMDVKIVVEEQNLHLEQ